MPTKQPSPAAKKRGKPAPPKPIGDGYDYDIFVSYRCEDVVREFVRTHFVPALRKRLPLEKSGWPGPGRTPRIFLDDSDVWSGQYWKEKIMGALPRSRIMICLWTPRYFESKWCEAEFRHFRDRHDILAKTPATAKLPSILTPIRLSDGEYFSKDSTKHQIKHDFTPFLREGLRTGTALWDDFEIAVINLAKYVVTVLENPSPAWQEWPVPDPDRIKIKTPPHTGGKPTI